jgi:5-formyltetrahydrofolate cyclo-ligase
VEPSPSPSKAQVRTAALAARRAMTPDARETAGAAIARAVLDLREITGAASVATYLSFGTEPATKHLIEVLQSRGVQVLVPVLRTDGDLDWSEYVANTRNAQNPEPPWQPAAALLGPHAVAAADVVLVPALAVDEHGMRLGRGGGSYDRALVRVSPNRPVLALLYDGECPVAVPVEPHDRPVTGAVTPREVLRFA